jgi:hypothetical protein
LPEDFEHHHYIGGILAACSKVAALNRRLLSIARKMAGKFAEVLGSPA